MQEFRFFDWPVYKNAKETFNLVLQIVEKLPQHLRFEFGNQLIRSALSIVLNIAEGSGKASDKELNRFFNIAIGSIYETLAAIDLAHDNKIISDHDFEAICDKLKSIARQLGGFKRKLK